MGKRFTVRRQYNLLELMRQLFVKKLSRKPAHVDRAKGARIELFRHVARRPARRKSFKRFWRASPMRAPKPELAHLSRRERRASAKALWRVVG